MTEARLDHVALLANLRSAWAAEDHPHAAPAGDAEIAAFEQRYGVRLPSDLRAYFAAFNGGDLGREGSMDQEMFSFWRLDQVRTQQELNEGTGTGGRSDLFGFADWSIDAHIFVIELHADPHQPTPVFIDFDGRELQQVAESFSAFLAGYLRDDQGVLYGVPRKSSA